MSTQHTSAVQSQPHRAAIEANRRTLTRWLISHTRALLPPLWISIAAAIIGQLLGVTLLVVGAVVLVHAATGDPAPVRVIIFVLVGVAVAKAALFYLEHYAGHWVAFTALQRLRELYFNSLIPQAPAATVGKAGAKLTEHGTRHIDRIEVFFAHTFPPAVASVVVPTIALTWLALVVDLRLALILAPFAVLLIVLPTVGAPASRRHAREIAAQRAHLSTHLGDDIQGIREVLAFDADSARLNQISERERELVSRRSASGLSLGLRIGLATALKTTSVLTVLIVAVLIGTDLLATAVTLAVAVALWVGTDGIDDFMTGLDSAYAATEAIRDAIEAPPTVTDPAVARQLPKSADVVYEGVCFSYPGASNPALTDVSLRLPQGEWSYLCGVSGSGKSTLAQLLMRGWDPHNGAVRLGETDLRDLLLDELRAHVGIVSQRPTTLSGSIAENVLLSASSNTSVDRTLNQPATPKATTVSDDAGTTIVMQALQAVALDDWVAGLPDGIDTLLSERGLDVSGGQLQRLALARALAARPRILILDEALSQLDQASAERVRAGIEQWDSDLTVIEITHRTDLIPPHAFVAVVDQGRIVATGDARELRGGEGPFTQLAARDGAATLEGKNV
ncbi:MAG: ABC transporter ATP-binding protein [Leucobacter sp.]|nr:ABC transporter ATP-binding protein [Leucobacter sp.]